ncbi:unnamed protein product [Phytomonas sp. Hart1]|nr:unnamed protein product [Phytomonas sp. Hart1]|eukprot:CCW71083.1 unnamed protein product [Phytomonas sp. isolate Hart1]
MHNLNAPESFGASLVQPPYRANEVQFQRFTVGLTAVLNQWTALHLVVQHCNRNALSSLQEDLISWHLENGEVYSDEMEDFFEEFFSTAHEVLIEDDSLKEVSDVLHEMYCRCCQNDFSIVEKFVQFEATYRQLDPVGQCVNAGVCTSDESDLGSVFDDDDAQQGNQTIPENPSKNEEETPAVLQNTTGNKKSKKHRKNLYKKSSDGWNVVQ